MLLAIVPAYNEEKTIGSVVRSLFDEHVDRVVVIDDGSEDRTADIAAKEGAIVLRHAINRGQGAALETGHAYARSIDADYALHFDADCQFDARDIAPALAAMKRADADILFGSRFLGIESNAPWQKIYIFFPLARAFHRLIGAVPLSDPHNGFRMLRKRALCIISLTQDKMAHATEIASLVKQHRLRYIEYPVHITYHEFGQGIAGGFSVMRDVLFRKIEQILNKY